MALAAYDTDTQQLLSQVGFASANESLVRMVIPPILNNTVLPFSLVVLQESNSGWVQASREYSAEVFVTNLAALTVETYPSIGFSLDGMHYTTNSTGFSTVQASLGQHVLQVVPFVYLSNSSRLRFVGWEDSTNGTSRQIQVGGDGAVEIAYVQQYFLRVYSAYGQPSSAGWYDANSSVAVLVEPPMLTSPPVIFSHWTGEENQSQVRTLVQMASPTAISAVWEPTNSNAEYEPNYRDPMFILSFLALIVLLILNVRTRSPKRED
jgi:antitoxin component of RelBE/YafQ-DinJ toxin-antitoxin module